MIKLVASDLDETLLCHGQLSDYTKDVLTRLMAKGIMFVPISARVLSEIDEWFKDNKNINYIGCSNGSIIFNNQSKEVEIRHFIKVSDIRFILDKASKVNKWWTIIIGDKMYSSKQILADREYLLIGDDYYNDLINRRIFVDDYDDVLRANDEINKLHFITEHPEDKEILDKELDEFKNDFKIVSSHITNIEITNTKASKGAVVEWLMEKYQLSKDEVMVFGDNDNDVSMFNVVANKVAVISATDALSKVKSDTCDDAINDGVAHYIEDNIL